MAKKITEESLRLNIIINGDAAKKQILDTEKALEGLHRSQKRLLDMRKRLENSGRTETKQYRDTEIAIKEVADDIATLTSKLENMRKGMPLTSMTLKDLRSHARQLRTVLERTVPGTENYRRLQRELQQTRSRMKELELATTATDNTLCGLAGRFRDYAIGATAMIGAGQKVLSYVNQATDAYKEQDEAMTDVMKTTNLTREQVASLNEELKKLDTRTAQNELLSLARIGGKLGIQGESDLLAFVSAADKINVALKEDLGGDAEGAIATVGKLVDIFQLEGAYGLEDALLKTGSAINELGMASTANEGYIVDFTSRLAGLAPNADISISKILGMGATLDKYGQQAETAGTAIGQTIMAMFKRTETFADIAKMPLQEFADLLNKDVNEALLRVLEGMNDGGGLTTVVTAMEAMHLNGQRASTILGTLSKNTEELRAQQELAADAFERGTSLQEEFNTKNTSATAIAEKRKKAIEEEVVTIGQKLLPVANGAMSLADMGLSIVSELVSVMVRYKAAVIAVTAAYAAYTVAKKASVAADKLVNFYSTQNKAALASEVLTLQGATKSTIALSAVKNLLAGNFKAAGAAAKIFFTSIKTGLGPIGWAVLAIEGLLALLSPLLKIWNDQRRLNKEVAESNRALAESYSDVTLQIEKEKSRLDQMKAAVFSAKTGSAERAAAIRKINSEYKNYLPSLLTEKSSNQEVATALANVNAQLERKIKLQAKEKGLAEVNENIDNQTRATMEGFVEMLEKSTGKTTTAAMRQQMNAAVLEYRQAIEKATTEAQRNTARSDLFSTYFQLGGNQMFFRGDKLRGLVKGLNTVVSSGNRAIEMLDQLYGKSEDPSGVSGWIAPTDEPSGDDSSPAGGGSSDSGDSNRLRALEDLVNESQRIIDAGNKDAAALERKRYSEELARFEASKDDLIAAGVDYQALLQQLELTHQAKLSQIAVKGFDDRIDLIKQSRDLERAQAENRHTEELDAAIRSGEDITALKEKQAKELADIDMKYALQLQDVLDEIVNMDGTIELDITGLTIEELNALKLKLEEIRKLRNDLSGTDGTQQGTDGTGTEPEAESGRNGTMLGLTSEEWETLFTTGADGWTKMSLAAEAFGNIANEAMNIVSKAMQRQTKLENQALKNFQKNNDKKKADLENRLNSGLITEAQYNASIQAMDAEYEAYQEQLALKQAKREKALALTQAIINTAMGVTNALASMVPPLNFVNAGIVAAMGAAEIALIASTPITTDGAEEGGDIFTKRRQDGKTFSARLSPKKRGLVSSPTVLVGENGAEYVIPNEGVKNPTLLPIIESIDNARRAGTLASLDFRSVYSPAVVSPGFAAGGFTPGTADTSTTVQQAAIMSDVPYEKILQLLEEISGLLKQPIPAIVTMLGPHGLVKAFESYNKMKKNGQA